MRNLHELNVRFGVLMLPWDGPVTELAGSDLVNETIVSIVPKNSVMSEFIQYYKDAENISGEVYDDPLSWQIIKTLYGILVLKDGAIDDVTARDGLQLGEEEPKYRVEQFNVETRLWSSLGVYEAGEFSWSRSPVVQDACPRCSCQNGLWRSTVSWRWDTWVTALAALAGLGVLCSFAVLVFLCSQCGQVLEGGQTTTYLLLAATTLTFTSMLPYCFQPGEVVCILRSVAPAASLTFLASTLVSRSLLLATADTAGLPGHASGALQAALLLLMLGVETGVLAVEGWHLRGAFYRGEGTCLHHSWAWLSLLAWPGLLLLLQGLLAPGIWRSRRNYKEGVLFSLSSLAVTLVTAAWVTVYILCAGNLKKRTTPSFIYTYSPIEDRLY